MSIILVVFILGILFGTVLGISIPTSDLKEKYKNSTEEQATVVEPNPLDNIRL